MKKRMITREDIVGHKDISGYLAVGRRVAETIEGRACGVENLPFLSLIADLVRECFPERFRYLEIGTLFGGSLCAVNYRQRRSEYEKFAGIDTFTYYGEVFDSQSDTKVSIERADRNVRYFGGNTFALFEGNSTDDKVRKRALNYLREEFTMLYIDGDHTLDGVKKDFEIYSKYLVPGGVIVFDDYNNDAWPGVTEFIDGLDKTGWNVIGGLTPNAKKAYAGVSVPTLFVMQKEV